jgi:hypothetical protein
VDNFFVFDFLFLKILLGFLIFVLRFRKVSKTKQHPMKGVVSIRKQGERVRAPK